MRGSAMPSVTWSACRSSSVTTTEVTQELMSWPSTVTAKYGDPGFTSERPCSVRPGRPAGLGQPQHGTRVQFQRVPQRVHIENLPPQPGVAEEPQCDQVRLLAVRDPVRGGSGDGGGAQAQPE